MEVLQHKIIKHYQRTYLIMKNKLIQTMPKNMYFPNIGEMIAGSFYLAQRLLSRI